jgi:hypothetical protein
MKKLQLVVISLLTSVLVLSCASNETSDSNKVAQSEIYQSYFVNYDASDNELEVSAGFRFGGQNGTTLRLVEKSNITYNNLKMNASTSAWTGTSYIYKMNGFVGSEHKFVYTNNDDEVFENSIPLLKAEPALKNALISKSQGTVIYWTGMPLSNKDEIEVILQDSVQSYSFYPKFVGAASLSLSPNNLELLKLGSGQICIRRSVTLSLQKGKPIGGVIGSEYQSNKIKCEFVK